MPKTLEMNGIGVKRTYATHKLARNLDRTFSRSDDQTSHWTAVAAYTLPHNKAIIFAVNSCTGEILRLPDSIQSSKKSRASLIDVDAAAHRLLHDAAKATPGPAHKGTWERDLWHGWSFSGQLS